MKEVSAIPETVLGEWLAEKSKFEVKVVAENSKLKWLNKKVCNKKREKREEVPMTGWYWPHRCYPSLSYFLTDFSLHQTLKFLFLNYFYGPPTFQFLLDCLFHWNNPFKIENGATMFFQ